MTMKPVRSRDPFLSQALDEHVHLRSAAAAIQHRLDKHTAAEATISDVQEAVELVQHLCQELAQHFAREEAGGYLEEAINHLPSIAPQAATLLKQHGELLQMARVMIADARGSRNPAEAWQALQRDCRQYFKKLNAHEAAEDAILERAFNEDLRLDQ